MILKNVIQSCNGLQLSALQLTRYLGNHFNYWAGGEFGQVRYPRAMLRIVLNRTLKHAGIRFPKPPESTTDTSSTDTSAAATADVQ